jgi:hypothetical protein
MSASINGADERRAKARAAVIARLAARLLPRVQARTPPPAPAPVVAGVRIHPGNVEAVFVPMPAPAAWAPVPVGPGTWRSSCDAINPDTGRRCCLLAGHVHAHRHGRTEFHLAAAPGTTHFPRAERLAEAAGARHGVDPRSF